MFGSPCSPRDSQESSPTPQFKSTGKTQRGWVEREVGGGIGMGNTCKSMADSCQCMTKPTTILKKKKSINSLVLSFLYSPTLTSIHNYRKNRSFD